MTILTNFPDVKMQEPSFSPTSPTFQPLIPAEIFPDALLDIMNSFRLWCGPCGRMMDPDDVGWSSLEHDGAHPKRLPVCYECYWKGHLDPVVRSVYVRLARSTSARSHTWKVRRQRRRQSVSHVEWEQWEHKAKKMKFTTQ